MIKLSAAIKGFLNNPNTNQILLIGTLQNDWEKNRWKADRTSNKTN
jgi:hypothetical protein